MKAKITQDCVMEILNKEKFIPLPLLVKELRKRYPVKNWDKRAVSKHIAPLIKENKVERMLMQYVDD